MAAPAAGPRATDPRRLGPAGVPANASKGAPVLRTRPILLAALFAGAAPAPGALAHAILVGSEPGMRATVAPGPADVVLRFNSRIDPARLRLVLVRPDRTEAILPLRDDAPPNALQARAETSAPGDHVLRWQVLAVDGHITRGELPFTVRSGAAASGAASPGALAAGGAGASTATE